MSVWAGVIHELTHRGIVRPERLQALQATLAPPLRNDPQALLRRLVEAGRITAWQIDEIAQGRGASLLLDRYLLRDLIGRGGMGVVYVAQHRELDRLEAMKLIRSDVPNPEESIGRFLREAKIVARLSHENIVQTYNCGRVPDGRCFLAMELLQGADLEATVRSQGPMDARKALQIARQAAAGLAHTHGQPQPIVHRDIKPSNLFLSRDGRVKILDLGLSRMKDWPSDSTFLETMTETGAFKGTVQYVSPEQIADPRAVDGRSDIYSLGCTLYFLLTGVSAFGGTNVLQTIRAHDQGQFPPLAERRPDLPEEVLAVTNQMMARRPEDRFDDCRQLIAAIDEALSGLESFRLVTAAPALLPEGSTLLAGLDAVPVLPDDRTAGPATASTWHRLPQPILPDPPSSATLETNDLLAWDWSPVPEGEFFVGVSDAEVDRYLSLFAMPDADEARAWLLSERPQRSVLQPPVFLAKFVVTRRQYGQFLEATRFRPPLQWDEQCRHLEADSLPVVGVSLDEALAFCRWAGVRLPTPAEWEVAARGRDGRLFPWGDFFEPEHCNTSEQGLGELLAVDQFPSGDSPFGLRQMVGNVWEWTLTEEGTAELRGGSCWSSGRLSGAAFLGTPIHRGYANMDVGFRVARPIG